MNTEIFLRMLTDESGKLVAKRCTQRWLEKNDLWQYLLDNTTDFGRESTVKEKIVFLETRQNRCVVCGAVTHITSTGAREFTQYCSSKCYRQTPEAKRSLEEHNLKQRKGIVFTQELLEDLYHSKKMNWLQIGKHLGISNVTVQHWFERFGIERRSHSENQSLNYIQNPRPYAGPKTDYDPEEIVRWYSEERVPMSVIADYLDCDPETVRQILKKLGVKRTHKVSRVEWVMMNFLDEIRVDYVFSDRTVISPLEIDFWIPSHKIGIETHRLFTHRFDDGRVPKLPGVRTRDYHFLKFKRCEEQGIRLYQFYEPDVFERFEIVKNMILASLSRPMTNLNARDGVIDTSPIREKTNLFYQINHIQGPPSNRSKSLTLVIGDEIAAVLSYEQSLDSLTITRFCTRLGTRVRGAFSRLSSYLPKCSRIVSYSSNAISLGSLYRSNGFECTSESIDMQVTDFKQIFNRRKFQKSVMPRLFGDNFDPSKTEIENLWANKMGVIFGAGIKTWVKEM